MKMHTLGPHREIRIWTEGRIFGSVFDGDITHSLIVEYGRIQSRFAAEASEKIVSLSFVRGGSPTVSEEVRSSAIALFGRTKDYTHCGAVVLEAPGMLGVILRSVVTGILFIARPPYPFRLLGTATAAEKWLNETAGMTAVERDTLKRLIREAG